MIPPHGQHGKSPSEEAQNLRERAKRYPTVNAVGFSL